MLKKKYLFEIGQNPNNKKFLLSLLIALTCAFVLYTLLCGIFVYYSHNQNEITDKKFYEKTPDLVIVFTGDQGRIPYAIKKAKEYEEAPHILISGVYNKNTIKSLMERMKIDPNKDYDPNIIDVDYVARNTIENVMFALKYLREKKEFKDIVVVSSDYHILRIKLIWSKITNKEDDEQFNVYFSSLKTDYTQWRNIKILYKEVFKILRTSVFLLLWDSSIDPSAY